MSTDWTSRIKIDNLFDDNKSTTLAKFAASHDPQWHTRPNDDQDAVLDHQVFHNYGAGSSSPPTDWFQFSFEGSDSTHRNVSTTGTFAASVTDQPKITQPHLEMRVDNNGDGVFDTSLTLGVWDKQSGWHGVPGQNIDALLEQTLNP